MTLKTDFASKPTLTGELIFLRPVEVADAAGLFAVDPETMRLTGSSRDSGFTLENLEVYDFNPRARHVYEKLGFVHEGTKRDALQWDGTWIDCHCMGLLDRDWPART